LRLDTEWTLPGDSGGSTLWQKEEHGSPRLEWKGLEGPCG
jgi:hypothetical protein